MKSADEATLLFLAHSIDLMFAEATSCGSWMAEAAADYRAIRRELWERFWIQIPDKYHRTVSVGRPICGRWTGRHPFPVQIRKDGIN